jgi:hypothetical protein
VLENGVISDSPAMLPGEEAIYRNADFPGIRRQCGNDVQFKAAIKGDVRAQTMLSAWLTSLWEIDDESICGTFGQVIFPKFRSQPGSVYSDDSSDSRIKFAVSGIELDSNDHLFQVLVRRG